MPEYSELFSISIQTRVENKFNYSAGSFGTGYDIHTLKRSKICPSCGIKYE